MDIIHKRTQMQIHVTYYPYKVIPDLGNISLLDRKEYCYYTYHFVIIYVGSSFEFSLLVFNFHVFDRVPAQWTLEYSSRFSCSVSSSWIRLHSNQSIMNNTLLITVTGTRSGLCYTPLHLNTYCYKYKQDTIHTATIHTTKLNYYCVKETICTIKWITLTLFI